MPSELPLTVQELRTVHRFRTKIALMISDQQEIIEWADTIVNRLGTPPMEVIEICCGNLTWLDQLDSAPIMGDDIREALKEVLESCSDTSIEGLRKALQPFSFRQDLDPDIYLAICRFEHFALEFLTNMRGPEDALHAVQVIRSQLEIPGSC